jgi:hypothetical protein
VGHRRASGRIEEDVGLGSGETAEIVALHRRVLQHRFQWPAGGDWKVAPGADQAVERLRTQEKTKASGAAMRSLGVPG